jgi:murein DD-endopeptidase MepM/ murein hydrolase activator NlpD
MRAQFLWLFAIILGFFFSCVHKQNIDNRYGDRVSYGTHVGIDYGMPNGTPIIACSDGEVIAIYEQDNAYYEGGTSIRILHVSEGKDRPNFISIYAHLKKPLVGIFERVERGQLIGLSGESNNGYPHLHFQLMKPGTLGEMKLSNTYNPSKFAISGKLQCFDPSKDYSEFSETEITRPVPCGEHRKELETKIILSQ